MANDECSIRAEKCVSQEFCKMDSNPLLKKVNQSFEKGEMRKCDDKTENGNHATFLFGGGVGACTVRHGGVGTNAIRSGDMQIHKDSKRFDRRKGVVQDVVKGRDGLVRKAMVRTSSGVTNRPISKLYPLEVNDIDCVLRRSERTSVDI